MQKLAKHKKVCSLFVLALCFVVGIGYFHVNAQGATDPLSEYQQQQSQIQSELKDLNAKVKEADKNLQTFQGQLETVENNISAAEQQLSAVEEQLSVAERQLEVTNNELQKSQDALSTQLTAFESRLRESYINGDVTMIDVLFDATSMEDFITRSYYMEQILEYDMEMMDTINARIDDIQVKRAEQEEKTTTLNKLKEAKQQAIAELEETKKEKTALVADAENEKEESQEAYEEMLALSNEIAKEIRQIQAANAASGTGGHGTGVFTWPLPSQYRSVSSPYGMRTHPTTGVYKMHTGIDLPAPSGTPIYAADDGVVIMARRNGAYGNCVIIDHGNNLATLYGHMSRIGTSNGASVKKGDIIGYVGTTGASTGNHLHFEVRVNGNHTSPWNYL